MFLEYIDIWIKENEGLISELQLKVEHVINHGGKKVEMGISNLFTKNGGTLELLDDGTCDMMIVNYETDESIYFDTVYLKEINQLEDTLRFFALKLGEAYATGNVSI